MSQPIIITAAITGAEVTKDKNPNLPVTPSEQAAEAKASIDAGACMIHLHVRDSNEKPTQDLKAFEKSISEIRSATNGLIQISTGGAVGDEFSTRLLPLQKLKGDVKPQMASLNMGSINFGEEVFTNLPSQILKLLETMQKENIKPECEIYDLGMLDYTLKLIKQGVLPKETHVQFVMGTPYGVAAESENLEYLVSKLLPQMTFTVAGIGRHQISMMELAAKMGGHIRVGMEDNIYLKKGELLKSNAQMVEKAVEISKQAGRAIASIQEAQKILGC